MYTFLNGRSTRTAKVGAVESFTRRWRLGQQFRCLRPLPNGHPLPCGRDLPPEARRLLKLAYSCNDAREFSGPEANRFRGEVLLARDFIAKSLYNRDKGYFCAKDVINDLPCPLDFREMLGEWHYRSIVKQVYQSKLSAWITPVEVFSPHFSHALARYITQKFFAPISGTSHSLGHRRGKLHARKTSRSRVCEQLVVYEVGGGTGTNALNVLNWLRLEEPELYKRTEYNIVEISGRLAERQRDRVCAVHENCHIVNADFLEWGMSGAPDERPCFFVGMEVLDNLPHDKIAWTIPSYPLENTRGALHPCRHQLFVGRSISEKLCEAVVIETPSGFQEKFRLLEDPVIRELVDLCPDLATMVKPSTSQSRTAENTEVIGNAWRGAVKDTLSGLLGQDPPRPDLRAAFIPTGCLQLLSALKRRLPRHRAILADFDSLPAIENAVRSSINRKGSHEAGDGLLALNSPIVSSRDSESGAVTDYDSYMVPLGSADIFFSTCFERLSRMHAMVCGAHQGAGRLGRPGRRGGRVMKQGEFLQEHGDVASTRTLTGYNPLLEDYKNASVFLSDS